MSITLRQATQQTLDNYKLQNYHCRVDSHKQLSIVSECGRTLCIAKGIEFSRLAPTKAEIKYSIELLDAFLAKNIKDIKELIELKAHPVTFKWFNITKYKNFALSIHGYSITSIKTIQVDLPDAISLYFSGAGTLESIKFKSKKTRLTALKIPASVYTLIDQIVSDAEQTLEYADKVEAQQSKVNSCSI